MKMTFILYSYLIRAFFSMCIIGTNHNGGRDLVRDALGRNVTFNCHSVTKPL